MKILLLSPNQIYRYNWGHQLFRNEIGKHHEVIYYGEGYLNYNKNLIENILTYVINQIDNPKITCFPENMKNIMNGKNSKKNCKSYKEFKIRKFIKWDHLKDF